MPPKRMCGFFKVYDLERLRANAMTNAKVLASKAALALTFVSALFIAPSAFGARGARPEPVPKAETADAPAATPAPMPVEPPASAPKTPAPGPAASASPSAKGPTVTDIQVRGNAKVESDAILTLLKSQKGEPLRPDYVKADIRALYELGYFADVRVFSHPTPGGVALVYQVAEKPAITSISYKGMKEITEDSLKDKLQTKLYTIVNEATITSDLRMIEKQYAEKGFYLASATYTLDKVGPNEVALTFHVDEGGKVLVGQVDFLGNHYFTTEDLVSKLATRPHTRLTSITGASIYNDDFLKRDLEFLSYYYRDHGFAEVKVAKPLVFLDRDRRYVRVTFQVEEGIQYNIGKLTVSGDLLFPEQELLDGMKLKPGKLFRYSQFSSDVEALIDKYGDLGYAFVDVNGKPTFHADTKTVDIDYEITKGEKVYFGDMKITGNTKTRDNVIRREIAVHDAELYSGTRLTESKKNIERLGFFDEVQVLKERDPHNPQRINLEFKVKEKPTGQLQAALGYTPGGGTSEQGMFGTGRYDEKNQSGRGYQTNVTARYNNTKNYEFDTSFLNPRVSDSDWSAGVTAYYKDLDEKLLEGVDVQDRRVGGSVKVGRLLVEKLSAALTYQLEKIHQDSDVYLDPRFKEEGLSSSVIAELTRSDINNYLDPSEGSEVTLSQQLTGGFLGGDNSYMVSGLDAAYYYPIDLSESFRTYFRFHGNVSYLMPFEGRSIPFNERFRLGGYDDLRGFDLRDVGPHFSILQSPGGALSSINKGGDKKLLFQAEYFVPLIPEAGIKSLIFTDVGRVYDETEALTLKDFSKDVGFGFRWITPIAPFRFEWAYPVQTDGKLGDPKTIFYIGY